VAADDQAGDLMTRSDFEIGVVFGAAIILRITALGE
jgi:hypothetical protein